MSDKLSTVDMAIKVDRNDHGAPRISWMERTVVDPRDKEVWIIRAAALVVASVAAFLGFLILKLFLFVFEPINSSAWFKSIIKTLDNYAVAQFIGLVLAVLVIFSPVIIGFIVYKTVTSMAFLVRKLKESNDEDDDPFIFEIEPYGGRTFLTVRRVLDLADHQGMRCIRIRIPQYFSRDAKPLYDHNAGRNHYTYIPLKQVRGVTLEENEPYKQYPGGLSFPVPNNIFLDVGDGETFTIASHFYDKQEMRRLRALIVKHLLGSTSATPSAPAANVSQTFVLPKKTSTRDDVI